MSEIVATSWVAGLASFGIVSIAVILHFEVIAMLNRRIKPFHDELRRGERAHRPVLLAVMFALLIAHMLEIGLFGTGFWLFLKYPEFGAIIGYEQIHFMDCVYFSLTNYTTVGWGDLAATGDLRILAGVEALVGFMLITWSASFVYLIMARTWGD